MFFSTTIDTFAALVVVHSATETRQGWEQHSTLARFARSPDALFTVLRTEQVHFQGYSQCNEYHLHSYVRLLPTMEISLDGHTLSQFHFFLSWIPPFSFQHCIIMSRRSSLSMDCPYFLPPTNTTSFNCQGENQNPCLCCRAIVSKWLSEWRKVRKEAARNRELSSTVVSRNHHLKWIPVAIRPWTESRGKWNLFRKCEAFLFSSSNIPLHDDDDGQVNKLETELWIRNKSISLSSRHRFAPVLLPTVLLNWSCIFQVHRTASIFRIKAGTIEPLVMNLNTFKSSTFS